MKVLGIGLDGVHLVTLEAATESEVRHSRGVAATHQNHLLLRFQPSVVAAGDQRFPRTNGKSQQVKCFQSTRCAQEHLISSKLRMR